MFIGLTNFFYQSGPAVYFSPRNGFKYANVNEQYLPSTLYDQLHWQQTPICSRCNFRTGLWKLCVRILRNTDVHPYCRPNSVLTWSNTDGLEGLYTTPIDQNKATQNQTKKPYQRGSKVLQVDGQGSLHSSPSHYHRLRLEHTPHHTQRIMHRPLHLVTHEVIGPTQNDGSCCSALGSGT